MSTEVPSGWEWRRLGRECEVLIGGTPARKEPAYWDSSRDGGHRWASISDLNQKYITQTKEHITDLGVQNSNVKLVRAGTVLMSFKLTIGRTAIAGCDLYTNEAIAAFVPKSDRVDMGFVYHALPSAAATGDIDQAVKGRTLNKAKLINLRILFPPFPEQKKIAAILSSVDEAIKATLGVVEQTLRVKEGMLQDLLTKGIGQARFKQTAIGEIPEAWEVCRLGEATEVTKLAGFEYTDHFDYSIGGEVTVVRALNLRDGVFDLSDTKTIPKAVSDALPRSRLREGDTLFTYVGVNVGEVALTPIGRFHLGPNVARITPSARLVPAYLCYYMQSQAVERQVQQLVSTTSQPSMSMTNIRQIRVIIPPRDVQERIVAAMAAVEQAIQLSRDTIRQLGVTKAGLLQDLLTGKVRVSV